MRHMTKKLPEKIKYKPLFEHMRDEGIPECGIGSHTRAILMDNVDEPDGCRVGVMFHDTVIAILFSSGRTVQVFHGGYRTPATRDRIDRCTQAVNVRVFFRPRSKDFRLYSTKSGQYRAYTEGMIIEEGSF